MIKKILLSIILISSIVILGFYDVSAGVCKYSDGDSVKGALENCFNNSRVLDNNMQIETGAKELIVRLVKNISIILSISAIGFIAYGSLMLVMSGGNDEKIKKGKEIIKWSIIGFAALLSASGLITLVVNIIYGIK